MIGPSTAMERISSVTCLMAAMIGCAAACAADSTSLPPEKGVPLAAGGNGGSPLGGTSGMSIAAGSIGNAGAGGGGQGGERIVEGGLDGAAGGDGGIVDNRTVALALDGYLLKKPCVDTYVPMPNVNQTCPEKPEDENQHRLERFGGDPNVTYKVTLRVRGINERHWYEGGTLDPNMLFYSGGRPTAHSPLAPNAVFTPGQGACPMHPPETDAKFPLPFPLPTEINPSDGCFNAYTIFALVVSAPKRTYYLNYTDDFDGKDRPAHIVHKTDYVVTFPVQGQAQLDFYIIDGDHHQVTNDGTMTVSGLKVAEPYNGTFLQLDVVTVVQGE
jgi:hypothetical protein